MQATETGIQHVNVKFFIKNPDYINVAEAAGVFQKWIQEDRVDDLLIDVADYRHVPEGPGVILVGHNAIYSLDEAEGRPGILFNRRTVSDAAPADQIKDGIETARKICGMLAQEDGFKGKLEFSDTTLQITINDRNLAPNTDETLQALKPDIESALTATLGEGSYTLNRTPDARSRFSVDITTDKPFTL